MGRWVVVVGAVGAVLGMTGVAGARSVQAPTVCSGTSIEACGRGDVDKCLAEADRKRDSDPVAAFCGAAMACDGKRAALGCALAAELLKGTRTLRPDRERARVYASKGCDMGFPPACVHEAELLTHARHPGEKGAAPKFARAAKLATAACEQGDALGCRVLGSMAWNSQLPLDAAEGWALLEATCGAAPGHGTCRAAQARAAIVQAQAACAGGDAVACHRAGRPRFETQRFPYDPAAGAEALRKGCELGDWAACRDAVRFGGREELRARSRELAARACADGAKVPAERWKIGAGEAMEVTALDPCVVEIDEALELTDEGPGDKALRVRLEKLCKKEAPDACLLLAHLAGASEAAAASRATWALLRSTCKRLVGPRSKRFHEGRELCATIEDVESQIVPWRGACRREGELEACISHADNQIGLGGLYSRAVRTLTGLCEAGRGAACKRLVQGQIATERKYEWVRLAKQACERGDQGGCL